MAEPNYRGRVLIVDDDLRLAERIRGLLAKYLYYVRVAGSLAEAQDELAQDQFDVVVTDWIMPASIGFMSIRRRARLMICAVAM